MPMTKPPSQARRSGPKPDTPGRSEFAAAFLQRNRQYRAAHESLGQNPTTGARSALARKWGLSFRLQGG
ncbi:transcriptional regulator domain-containing protein [Sphingobium sp. YC-XJ3]|uniref:transcriptional regulator domain-containing protein n=2 Tax=Sphingomonadaceae TaxID=41297 RepID=UPI0009EC5EC6